MLVLNDLGEEGEQRVREAYGQNYERLLALKQKYDPTKPRRLLAINLNRTFHLLRKPDILICYQHDMRTAAREQL